MQIFLEKVHKIKNHRFLIGVRDLLSIIRKVYKFEVRPRHNSTIMKILIRGGAGYKVSSLAPALIQNYEVDVLDHHISPECTLIPFTKKKNFNFIKKDIRDVKKKDISKYDLIIHLAGLSGYPACEANPGIAESVNVDSTKNLCNLMSKNQKLIYASTTFIY